MRLAITAYDLLPTTLPLAATWLQLLHAHTDYFDYLPLVTVTVTKLLLLAAATRYPVASAQSRLATAG